MTTIYKRYRIRMYVGPTAVEQYAARARALGYTDIIEGTEHINFNTGWLPVHAEHPETDKLCHRQAIGSAIYGQHRHVSVWRDVEILRTL